MNGATSTTQQLLLCPACKNPIHAHFSLSVDMDDVISVGLTGSVDATVRITGMRVEHDCTRKAKRSEASKAVDEFMGRHGSDAQ